MSEYTKGPWNLVEHCTAIEALAFDGSSRFIVDRVRGGNRTQMFANARLIAAAPELLEALKLAQEMLLAAKDTPACSDPMWSEIANAIAKAESR